MPITINGSGTIGGVSVGGLPDGIVDADMLALNAVTTAKISDSQVTEAKLASDTQKGLAKAWVYFEGNAADISSTANGYNVSSITDNGAGDYTVVFTTDMANTNYAVAISGKLNGGQSAIPLPNWNSAGGFAVNSFRFQLSEATSYGTTRDSNDVCFVVFGD